jgi:hypothetical protein
MRHRFITLALTGTLALVSQATPLKAQDICAAQPDALILRQAIPLAEAMPEQSGAGPWPRIFHQKTVALTYEPGQQLLLAGVSPNGSSPRLRTDDLARIDVFPSGLHWEHDFRDAARTRIDPLTERPDLSGLFVEGSNQITLTLTDLLGPSWSTSNYTLEVWEPCQEPVTAVMEADPVESSDTAMTAFPLTDTAAATIIDLVPAEVITALMTAERGAALPTDEALAALVVASEAPTVIPTATPMPTATAGAVALAKAEALQTPLPVPATLQKALPAAASPVAVPVTEDAATPALAAPAPSGGRLWRLFFALALLVGGWCYYRYGGQWRELLTQMRGQADDIIPVARQQLLTLWHLYAEEHYHKLVKVLAENNTSKRR